MGRGSDVAPGATACVPVAALAQQWCHPVGVTSGVTPAGITDCTAAGTSQVLHLSKQQQGQGQQQWQQLLCLSDSIPSAAGSALGTTATAMVSVAAAACGAAVGLCSQALLERNPASLSSDMLPRSARVAVLTSRCSFCAGHQWPCLQSAQACTHHGPGGKEHQHQLLP